MGRSGDDSTKPGTTLEAAAGDLEEDAVTERRPVDLEISRAQRPGETELEVRLVEQGERIRGLLQLQPPERPERVRGIGAHRPCGAVQAERTEETQVQTPGR